MANTDLDQLCFLSN